MLKYFFQVSPSKSHENLIQKLKKKKKLMFGKQDLKNYNAAPAMGVINVMNSLKPTPYVNIYWISHSISGISQILHVFWSVNSL